MDKKLLFAFLLILICAKASPAVFVVVSNADSGPGTFRDALTQAAANGSASTDYINFNLPDLTLAGRTITLTSQLPDISSNLVIDGSTQPGAPFGVSYAKVCLAFNSTGQIDFTALTIKNQSNIKIYSLYISLTNTLSSTDLSRPVGIRITATDNLQLGDIQKGNVIAGFLYSLTENADLVSQSNNLVLKSNFFNIQTDGLTGDTYFGPFIHNIDNLIVGGNANEGNLFATGFFYAMVDLNRPMNVLFSNNKSGVNYNLTAAFPCDGTSIEYGIKSTVQSSANSLVNIEDNVFCAAPTTQILYPSGLVLSGLGGKANIVRNYVGVDRNLKQLGALWQGIYVQVCKEVHVGDNNINDANYIGYCWPLFAQDTGDLTFTKNSFFCTLRNFVYNDISGQQRPQCNTTVISAKGISGTADPNSIVDLYYSDKCNTCAAQTYFVSVTTDAAGNWAYNGTISGVVIANATIGNMSSEFTYPRITVTNIKVTAACGGKGSITGIKTFGATSEKWIDGNRNVVGTTDDLLDVKAGRYKLLIDNGGCKDSTDYYQVKPKFILNDSNVVITNPVCGNSAGAISGLNIINEDNGQIDLSWIDANSKVWGNTLELQNVPAGTYSLIATGKDTCTQTYGPVILRDINNTVPAPSANNVKLCATGEAQIKVNNTSSVYSYRLYDSENSTSPIAEQKDGVFKVVVNDNKTYYVSALYFNCESSYTPVSVEVGLKKSNIANSFTPNGDGINDYWVVPGIETFPNATVQVFDRAGQNVFESKKYTNTFDGKLNGKDLPAGVYYYVIHLSSYCNILTGSLTIIR